VKLIYSHNGNSQNRVAYITFDESFADYMVDIDRADSFTGSKYFPADASARTGQISYRYFKVLENLKSLFSLDVFHVSDRDMAMENTFSILKSIDTYEKVIVLPLENEASRQFLTVLFSAKVPESRNRVVIGTEVDWKGEICNGSLDENTVISTFCNCQVLHHSENIAISSLNDDKLQTAHIEVFHLYTEERQQNYRKRDICIFILDETLATNRQAIAMAQQMAKTFPALEIMVFQPPFSLFALHDAFKMAKFLMVAPEHSLHPETLNDARSYGVVTLEHEAKSGASKMFKAKEGAPLFLKYCDHSQASEIIGEMLSSPDTYKEVKMRQYEHLRENFSLNKVSSRMQNIIFRK